MHATRAWRIWGGVVGILGGATATDDRGGWSLVGGGRWPRAGREGRPEGRIRRSIAVGTRGMKFPDTI